jgi:hypothetical protein
MNVRLAALGCAVFALVAPGRVPTVCPYRRLTGRRCPFCGLTGATGAALVGDLRRARRLHPLGLPVAVGLCIAVACGSPSVEVARRPVSIPPG